MNDTMIKNVLTPIFGLIATFLATKFNFLGMDQASWNTLVTTVGFGAVTIILGIFNRTTNLMNTVASQPGTTVVTTAQNAAAVPNPDVIAATPKIVQAVSEAKT